MILGTGVETLNLCYLWISAWISRGSLRQQCLELFSNLLP